MNGFCFLSIPKSELTAEDAIGFLHDNRPLFEKIDKVRERDPTAPLEELAQACSLSREEMRRFFDEYDHLGLIWHRPNAG